MSSQIRREAIKMLQAGDLVQARRLLIAAIREKPRDELAWFWFMETLSTDQDRLAALQHFLKFDPSNQKARRALLALRSREENAESGSHSLAENPEPEFPSALRFSPMTADRAGNRSSTRKSFPVNNSALLSVAGVICLLAAVVFFVRGAFLRGELTTLSERIVEMQEQHAALELNHNALVIEHDLLSGQYENLERIHDDLIKEHNGLVTEYSGLAQQYEELVNSYDLLLVKHDSLQRIHDDLATQFGVLQSQHNELQSNHDDLLGEYSSLSAKSITPPYIYIHGRNVEIAFVKRDGSIHKWQVPFESLQTDIQRGYRSRELEPEDIPTLELSNGTGSTFTVMDFRPFVDPRAFERVMEGLEAESGSDAELIAEIWNIVTQLATYSDEIEETPRYPLETFLAGGGDCEDTAILFASMVKAVPIDWEVQLIYMDSNNPRNPVGVNHAMVFIDTGTEEYWIETTGGSTMQPHGKVGGWYFSLEQDA